MNAFDAIAGEWNKFRTHPISSLYVFLPYLKGDETVLDAGCGNGRNLVEIAKQCRQAYGIDVSKKMILEARKKMAEKKTRAVLLPADIRKIPFPNDFFDVVFCLAVLHHLKPLQQKKALKEMERVLKPGGRMLVSVWNKRHPKLRKLGKARNRQSELIPWTTRAGKAGERYYYFFERKELREKTEKAGFSVERVFFERKGKEAKEEEAHNLCLVGRRKQ